MANSTFTHTGKAELREAIERFPASITAACRRVAQGTANAILVDARRRLLGPADPALKGERTMTGALAAAIEVDEDAANKQFRVTSFPPIGAGTNLPIWREHGTITQPPRPYMRPAAQAAMPRYQSDMQQAVEQAARETFKA